MCNKSGIGDIEDRQRPEALELRLLTVLRQEANGARHTGLQIEASTCSATA